jgi:hypothetical protein
MMRIATNSQSVLCVGIFMMIRIAVTDVMIYAACYGKLKYILYRFSCRDGVDSGHTRTGLRDFPRSDSFLQ